MIFLPTPMLDFTIESVASRQVPNSERVVVRVNYDTSTTNVGMMIAFRHPDQRIVPLNNRMLWLGSGNVKRGSIINVFTGHGTAIAQENGNGTSSYNLFWGLDFVAFDRPELEPVLFRLGDTTIGVSPDTPALGVLGSPLHLGYQGNR